MLLGGGGGGDRRKRVGKAGGGTWEVCSAHSLPGSRSNPGEQPAWARPTSLAVSLSWGVCGDMVGVGWLEDGEEEVEEVEEEWLCCKRSGKR